MPKNKSTTQHHRCRRAASIHADKRLLCSDLIKLRWVDGKAVRREEIVVLEGYSNTGASLFTGLAIAEGTAVTLCGGGEEFRATVLQCGHSQNGYLVGVGFGEQAPSFAPEHLLDPSLLSYSVEP